MRITFDDTSYYTESKLIHLHIFCCIWHDRRMSHLVTLVWCVVYGVCVVQYDYAYIHRIVAVVSSIRFKYDFNILFKTCTGFLSRLGSRIQVLSHDLFSSHTVYFIWSSLYILIYLWYTVPFWDNNGAFTYYIILMHYRYGSGKYHLHITSPCQLVQHQITASLLPASTCKPVCSLQCFEWCQCLWWCLFHSVYYSIIRHDNY